MFIQQGKKKVKLNNFRASVHPNCALLEHSDRTTSDLPNIPSTSPCNGDTYKGQISKKRQLKEASSSSMSDNFLGNKGRVYLSLDSNQQRDSVNK